MATPSASPPQSLLTAADLDRLKQVEESYQKQIELASQLTSEYKKQEALLIAEAKRDQERIDALNKIKELTDAIDAKNKALQDKQNAITTSQKKNAEDDLKAANERIALIEKEIQKNDEATKKGIENSNKLNKAQQDDEKKLFEQKMKNINTFAQKFQEVGNLSNKVGSSLLDGFNFPILGIRIKGLRDIMTDVIKAPAEAFKKYGFLDQYTNSINNMRESMLGAGIGEQQMYEAFGDLNQVVADFPTYSRGAQEQLVGTSAKLALAGFNSKTTATSFNNLVKVFGQTATQANNTNIRLAALSKTLGDGNKTFEDFTALTPKLTGFGGKAVDVFEKTSIAAKKLGMDTKELFGIMDQYDSFENAANAAGELNVALGGQFVDSLELMKASIEGGPTDVLNMLQKSFKESGVQVENLSRAQLKYFASAAKIPEDQFKKIFAAGGQGVDDYIRQQEKAAKEQENLNNIAKKTQDVFQDIQNAFAAAFGKKENIDALVKVVMKIKDMALSLADAFKTMKNMVPIMGALFATAQVTSFVSGILQAVAAQKELKKASLGAAIAEAFKTALGGWTGVAAVGAGLVAGGAAYLTLSNLMGESGGEAKPTIGAVAGGAAGAVPTAAAEPPMPVHQDAFAPGGSMITTPQGGKFKTSAQDSVIAAKDGGVLAEKLNEISGLLREYLERPVPVMLDGKKVNSELARANKYNPFTA